jgi:hypothetical protein
MTISSNEEITERLHPFDIPWWSAVCLLVTEIAALSDVVRVIDPSKGDEARPNRRVIG